MSEVSTAQALGEITRALSHIQEVTIALHRREETVAAQQGCYLGLSRGQADPEANSPYPGGVLGPLLGPCSQIVTNYASQIKLHCPHGTVTLYIINCMIYYDGFYYGDWTLYPRLSELYEVILSPDALKTQPHGTLTYSSDNGTDDVRTGESVDGTFSWNPHGFKPYQSTPERASLIDRLANYRRVVLLEKLTAGNGIDVELDELLTSSYELMPDDKLQHRVRQLETIAVVAEEQLIPAPPAPATVTAPVVTAPVTVWEEVEATAEARLLAEIDPAWWTLADHRAAMADGWGLFYVNRNWKLHKVDASTSPEGYPGANFRFADDRLAAEHITFQANIESRLHLKALRFLHLVSSPDLRRLELTSVAEYSARTYDRLTSTPAPSAPALVDVT